MQAIATVALPVFALMAFGYAAVRLRLVGDGTTRGLNDFVFWFALPALLVVRVAEAPLERLVDLRLIAAYYIASLAVFAAAVLIGRWLFRADLTAASLQGLASTFGNSGYLGIALVLTAFGPAAVLPVVIVLTFDNVLLTPMAVALIEATRGRGGGLLGPVRSVFAGLARNPMIVAILAGFVLALLGLPLPLPLLSFGNLLGAAAGPCALFALGSSLVGVPIRAAKAEIATWTALKLLVLPALVWFLAGRVFGLDPMNVIVLTLVAGLPTAATVFVLAQRYETYVMRASTVVLVSHVVAVVTVSAFLAAFG